MNESSIVKGSKLESHGDEERGGGAAASKDLRSTSSRSSSQSSSFSDEPVSEEERDEVKEVLAMAKHDTFRVRVGRVAVTCALLATAVAVTLATYFFLEREEDRHFLTGFEQFSRSIGDAAINHQADIRDAYDGFARAVSSNALAAAKNASSWPRFTLPYFESYAAAFRKQARAEALAVINVVKPQDRQDYEAWARENYQEMVRDGSVIRDSGSDTALLDESTYYPYLFGFGKDGKQIPDVQNNNRSLFGIWSFSPPPSRYSLINWNPTNVLDYEKAFEALFFLQNETVVTRVRPYSAAIGTAITKEEHQAMHAALSSPEDTEHPHSFFYHPVHRDFVDPKSEIVAVLGGGHAWDAALIDLLPTGVVGLVAVIQNNCNQSYTYEINGPVAHFLGEGDLHDDRFNYLQVDVDLAATLHSHPEFFSTPGHCQFSMHVYPSTRFRVSYNHKTPEIFSLVVATTFVFVAIAFFVYDLLVHRRNQTLVANAAKSNAIVSSLFPSTIRDRLMTGTTATTGSSSGQLYPQGCTMKTLKSYMSSGGSLTDSAQLEDSKPLADLFLETTVLFADISGFTAWSSVREPSQVFTLLETIYASFDVIAKRRRVFKVETVGDCYVAVTGLPDYRADHAVVMARFAHEILHRMTSVTSELETTLGPATVDLGLRIGMHSGAVTAGILRGERSRFQLFGDTMNTASRMESTGERGKIHISKESAELIIEAGKSSWVSRREERIEAKGKGILTTYWLNVSSRASSTRSGTGSTSYSEADNHGTSTGAVVPKCGHASVGITLDSKTARLIDWNVVQLLRLIKQIVARRNGMLSSASKGKKPQAREVLDESRIIGDTSASRPLLEVQEIIMLPEFNGRICHLERDSDSVELPAEVEEQLRDYVSSIAAMYRPNHFHSFDHCTHVTMSVLKLMSRIVAPTDVDVDEEADKNGSSAKRQRRLHDHTYGITSDPLTQFACAFSALIHDVDHSGVPNTQLAKENQALTSFYGDRSVAEQNSLDLAWDLLMESDRYAALRQAIYSTEAELLRFRQLVVNSVMATDICDKELKNLRNERWDRAFSRTQENGAATDSGKALAPAIRVDAGVLTPSSWGLDQSVSSSSSSSREDINRKATIVIEHLIQASDVSHTMQHWHVYRKWNERFFAECYKAFLDGRAEVDPSVCWYEGEIGFFDFYIIPLAKKLKDCGVFGKSSDEYLNYARQNRREWEERGRDVVAEMLDKFRKPSSFRERNESLLETTMAQPSECG